MKYQFTGISRITLEHSLGSSDSSHVSTEIQLEVSKNLDARQYNDRGVPRKEGVKPLTLALTQGLIANIHAAHDKGYWDSAEHLRYIIRELERGFASVTHVSESDYKQGVGS